eukprot:5314258-Pyramimonas_sp.AAC.3
MAPMAQEAFQTAPGGLHDPQDGPKDALWRPSGPLSRPADASKTAPRRQTGQEAIKTAQDAPKWPKAAQDAHKIAPKSPKRPLRWPQWPKRSSRRHQDGPKGLPNPQDGLQDGPEAPQQGPKSFRRGIHAASDGVRWARTL